MWKRAVASGVVGGLVGGVAFGIVMVYIGMLPMVAKLVHASSPAVGWLVHLGISAVIGAMYGGMVEDRVARVGPSLAAGAGYGILWWILGPLTLMPLFLGMGLGAPWDLQTARQMLPSLAGHLLYGLVLAATYQRVGRRVGILCRC